MMTRCSWALAVAEVALLSAGAASAKDLGPVAKALAPLEARFPSVRATVRVTDTRTPAYYMLLHVPRSRPVRSSYKFDWAVKAGKLYIDQTDPSGTGGATAPPFRHIVIFDGGKEFDIDESAQINGKEAERVWNRLQNITNPMDFGYEYRGQWYYRILQTGVFRISDAAGDGRQGDTTVITGDTDSGAHLKLFIDSGLGNMVVRLEEMLPDGDLCTFEATDARNIRGVWLPVVATHTWSMPADGKQTLLERQEYVLEDVRAGAATASLFTPPKLLPGASVTSETDGRYFNVGSSGELIPAGTRGHSAEPPAGPRWPGWIFLVSTGTLVYIVLLRLRRPIEGAAQHAPQDGGAG